MQVLVVDDDAGLRGYTQLLLEAQGHIVLTAADGREALACLETATPAVILLDLQMPVMNGWELFRQLRQHGPAVPVVFMSAGTNAEAEAVAYGAAGYLAKPFDSSALLALLGRVRPDLIEPAASEGASGNPAPARELLAILNSNDQLLVLLQEICEAAGFDTLTAHLLEVGRTPEAVQAFLGRHNPRTVVYDVSPPYPEEWALLLAVREAEAARASGRRFVITTPNKQALEDHVGPTDAIELVGDRLDREAIARAVGGTTRV